MKVLVTGAAGFIGFHLCRRLAGRGDEIIGIDSINHYYDPALKYARLSSLGSQRPRRTLARSAKAPVSLPFPSSGYRSKTLRVWAACLEIIDSTACFISQPKPVRYSIENPRAYISANIDGFLNILEGCRSIRAKHLVFASSSSVYGLSRRIPFSEHVPADHPVSLYAATKRSNEMMAHVYSHLYGIPSTGLRFFTVYGPWGRPDMAYFKFARAITEGTPIDLYNSGDLKRDFTYIDDVVSAVERVVDRPPAPDPHWTAEQPDLASSSAPFRIYNVGNNNAEPLGNLVTALERCLGKRRTAASCQCRPGDVFVTEADIADMTRDFGWRPSTTLNEGVARFIEWYKSRAGSETQ